MIGRGWRHALALGASIAFGVGSAGCEGKSTKGELSADSAAADSAGNAQGDAGTKAQPLPRTAAQFLSRLAPVPQGSAHVVYKLRGPAGSEGELEVYLGSGMRRLETWSLRLQRPGAEAKTHEVKGRAQMHAGVSWSALEGELGERYDLPFAAIGDRYLAADETQQKAWVGRIDAWHASLTQARAESPGERETVAGVSCLRMQLAGQDLCVWEETGLPLRHRGAAFELEAKSVELGVELPASILNPPDESFAKASVVPSPEGMVKADEFFDLLERQDAAALAVVLTPGLRLPDPTQLAAFDPPQ